jgi:hypothetical protein
MVMVMIVMMMVMMVMMMVMAMRAYQNISNTQVKFSSRCRKKNLHN